MSKAGEEQPDPALVMAALRARGAQRLDPARFRHIEALARRASAHQGEVRRLLDGKLARLLAACDQALESPRSAAAQTAGQAPQRSALADLLAHLARHADDPLASGLAGVGTAAPSAATELKAVRHYRSTWSRLSVDRRMTQSLATVPENAGPLNTQRLMHQALTTMRAASPEYLYRFMSHVEALLWLDQASMPAAGTKNDTHPGSREKGRAGRRAP
jgi:hypothetical protein